MAAKLYKMYCLLSTTIELQRPDCLCGWMGVNLMIIPILKYFCTSSLPTRCWISKLDHGVRWRAWTGSSHDLRVVKHIMLWPPPSAPAISTKYMRFAQRC